MHSLPFFDSQTGEQLGTFSDVGTRFGSDDGDNCVGTGAFSFDRKNNTYYESQVFLQ